MTAAEETTMNDADNKPKSSNKKIGAALFVAAAVSVFVIDWKPEVEEAPPPIRPLKTIIVGEAHAGTAWQFPGKVSAGEQATMAFEVAGTVKELLVKEADRVEKGQVLARLDERDYVNELKSAQAELDRAKAQFDRMKVAAAANAVSEQELSNARAGFDQAKAELDIKAKALEDTELKASFSGTIASTFVKAFENVKAKQEVLSLQDLSRIEIKASIPEARIAQADPGQRGKKETADWFFVTFDYFPGRTFPVIPEEFSTEADPATQTYTATFVMDTPDDVLILPGMTAMVSERLETKEEDATADSNFLLPLDAVPVDGVGQYFIWVVEQDEGDVYSVTRRDVTVGELSGGSIIISSGVNRGERIAGAGVHILQEGQKVKLLSSGS